MVDKKEKNHGKEDFSIMPKRRDWKWEKAVLHIKERREKIIRSWDGERTSFSDRLLERLPDWCTGRREEHERRYTGWYGLSDPEKVRQSKKQVLKQYTAILLLFVLLLCLIAADSKTEPDSMEDILKRPDFGQPDKYVTLDAAVTMEPPDPTGEAAKKKAKGDSLNYQKRLQLRISPAELSDHEKKRLLKQIAEELPEQILGENESLYHVQKPLLLQRQDDKGWNVRIHWTSEEPELLSHEGMPNLLQVEDRKEVSMLAVLRLDNIWIEKEISCILAPAGELSEYSRSLADSLEKMRQNLSDNQENSRLTLPQTLTDRFHIDWTIPNESPPYLGIILMLSAALILVYRTRHRRAEAEFRNYCLQIQEDLPDLVSKFILLLNAGLVATSALEHIADAENTDRAGIKRPLYRELAAVQRKVRESNASYIRELTVFAQRTGVRELLRFTAILSDNLDKGSALAEKLEAENEALWSAKVKSAEEWSRKAETKMSFPLMLLLLVLVVITTAPVLLEM